MIFVSFYKSTTTEGLIGIDNASIGMAEVTVHNIRDWISDYKTLSCEEINSFASTIIQNNDLIKSIFVALEEKRYHQEFLEPVCHQLFSFYRSREETLQIFTLQYLPVLIGLYLSSIAKGNRKNVRNVEVLLLGIYNLEVTDSLGKPVCMSFRIPSVSKPSIYHVPMSLAHSLLTEHALSKLECAESHVFTIGPYKEVEKINASNRLQVMTVLMWLYNRHVGKLSTFSHAAVCKMCSRIVKQGYNRTTRSNYSNDCSTSYGNTHPRPIARIPLSSALLLEMVHAAYFAMFNGFESQGLQSLEELHNRAMHEMLSDVLLVTNGIRNSLKSNPSGQPRDGPMGISIALSPTTSVTSVSRAVITNASFRTKKLPDDIPIQEDSEGTENHHLSAINEEEDLESSRPGSSTSHAREKKPSSASITNVTSSISSKVSVLQLRRDKDKIREKKKDILNAENGMNGKSVILGSLVNSMSESALSDQNSHDIDGSSFFSSEQVFRNSYSNRTDLSCRSSTGNKSPLDVDQKTWEETCSSNTKCNMNHSGQNLGLEFVNDAKFIIQPTIVKSESANGQQNASFQTIV